MQIDKAQIIAWLTSRGEKDTAGQVAADLPDQVDTDQHAGLLDKLGINPADLPLPAGGTDTVTRKLGL